MVSVTWTNNYTTLDPNKKTKMSGNDRVFVLKQIEGKDPVDTRGLFDKRLFTGENKLHAIRDEMSTWLWYFKYDTGILPEYLRGRRYTKFNEAVKDVEKYFNSRNIKIEEVID
jgi:hypothetical protein